MAKRGGKREGAGRKKGMASIKAEEARKYLCERVAGEMEEILAGQIELAKGVYSEVETGEGYRRIYRKPPDPKAAAYLLNQLVGKAKETLSMDFTEPFSLLQLAKRAAELETRPGGGYHSISSADLGLE
jgi:hypothetical protein